MNLHVFPNPKQQVDACVSYLVSSIQKILQTNPAITIAVSGGKSPITLFQKLSTSELDFSRVTFILVDERITSTNSNDSNENLIRTHLLKNQAAVANFIGLINSGILNDTDRHTHEAQINNKIHNKLNNSTTDRINSNDNYNNNEHMLVKNANNRINNMINDIDIAILGMGADGHTASIFPNCPELEQIMDLSHADSKDKYHLVHPITAKYSRISLNLSAILAVKHLILNIDGNIKLDIFKEAILGDNPNYPISYILTRRPDTQVFWHE